MVAPLQAAHRLEQRPKVAGELDSFGTGHRTFSGINVRVSVLIVPVRVLSYLAVNNGVIVYSEVAIVLTLNVSEPAIPFVNWHVSGMKFAKTPLRPRVNYLAVHGRFSVAACLVMVADDAVLFRPHVCTPCRVHGRKYRPSELVTVHDVETAEVNDTHIVY